MAAFLPCLPLAVSSCRLLRRGAVLQPVELAVPHSPVVLSIAPASCRPTGPRRGGLGGDGSAAGSPPPRGDAAGRSQGRPLLPALLCLWAVPAKPLGVTPAAPSEPGQEHICWGFVWWGDVFVISRFSGLCSR